MEKKFVLTVTEDPDGMLQIKSKNTGFSPLEILGILATTERDIVEKAKQPANFVHKEDDEE